MDIFGNLPGVLKGKLEVFEGSKKSFFTDRINRIGFVSSGLLNIIHWVVLYSKIKPGRNTILLHYNVIYGSDFVEKSLYLYLIPLLALVFLIINFFVGRFFYRKEKLSSYFLSLATIAVQAVFFTATLVLIIVND